MLGIYLEGLKAIGEPARLPCCDFPSDYAARKGGSAMVDVRKCLFVADKVGGRWQRQGLGWDVGGYEEECGRGVGRTLAITREEWEGVKSDSRSGEAGRL